MQVTAKIRKAKTHRTAPAMDPAEIAAQDEALSRALAHARKDKTFQLTAGQRVTLRRARRAS